MTAVRTATAATDRDLAVVTSPLVAIVAPDGTDLAPTALATGWRVEPVPAGGLRDTRADVLLVTAGLPSDPSLLTEALSLLVADRACGCIALAEHTVLFRRGALQAARGFIEHDLAAVAGAVVDRVEALGWRIWEIGEPPG